MSKKDYIAIAATYAQIYQQYRLITYADKPTPNISTLFDNVVCATADMLERNNDRFDRDRFLKAIYPAKE